VIVRALDHTALFFGGEGDKMGSHNLLSSRGDRGAALITVVMVSFLVMALFMMALTHSMIGSSVTQVHLQRKNAAECARGYLDIASKMITLANMGESIANINSGQAGGSVGGPLATSTQIATTTDDTLIANGTADDIGNNQDDETVEDFIEEIRGHKGLAADDITSVSGQVGVSNAADMTINQNTIPGCGAANVDVDALDYDDRSAGGNAPGGSIGYHDRGGESLGCDQADYYAVTIVMVAPAATANIQPSVARSVYRKC
jgi:Tfp pilus assembly protein PilX